MFKRCEQINVLLKIVLRGTCVQKELKSNKITAACAASSLSFNRQGRAFTENLSIFIFKYVFSTHIQNAQTSNYSKNLLHVLHEIRILRHCLQCLAVFQLIYKNSPLHYKTNFIGRLIADTKPSQGICGENQNLEGIHNDLTLINSFSKRLLLRLSFSL